MRHFNTFIQFQRKARNFLFTKKRSKQTLSSLVQTICFPQASTKATRILQKYIERSRNHFRIAVPALFHTTSRKLMEGSKSTMVSHLKCFGSANKNKEDFKRALNDSESNQKPSSESIVTFEYNFVDAHAIAFLRSHLRINWGSTFLTKVHLPDQSNQT